jgi:hypothetical protein
MLVRPVCPHVSLPKLTRRLSMKFVFASRPALGPTQPPIRWVPKARSSGVKQPGREANHLPPYSSELKNTWS